MSTVKANNVQIGQSLTPTDNFTIYQPTVPDGTLRVGVGNSGSATEVFRFTSDGASTISANSSSDALRITQTGSGNALVVEDSANPDSTPFVVNTAGDLIVGSESRITYSSALSVVPKLQINALGAAPYGISRFSNTSSSNAFWFLKSRGTSFGDFTVLQNGDDVGTIAWLGSDGTDGVRAASISAQVDGTPGTNDMPGRLVFSTTADGESSPTERMRIRSDGGVGIGSIGTSIAGLHIQKPITGAVTAYNVLANATVQSDVTSTGYIYYSIPSTQATAFTLTSLVHYTASQGTLGAGSSVTNQMGFIAQGTMTGATNNYGFYSNIASGTGRWNFYAAGTADNYFAGNVCISSPTGLLFQDSGYQPRLQLVSTGVQASSIGQASFVGANAINCPRIFIAKSRGATVGDYTIVQNGDQLGVIQFEGSDGTDSTQAASILAAVDGTPGTNDMPGRLVFSTTSDGASSPTERLRIDSAGNVLVTSSGALGYGTGSGGAVTQGTSRTTGVTLNKTNGAITLVSAAGSTTWQSFTVTNSTVAATDVVIVSQKSGTDLYEIHVTAVAAGSFRISFRTTGGTTTEQPVFNFAVINAVTA